MVFNDYKVDDLVWAKMKHFSFWPARVINHPSDGKPKKGSHYVFFFGTNNCAWIVDENIVPHSDEQIQSFNNKKKSALLQEAIDTIMKEYEIKPKTLVKEVNFTEEKELPKKSSPQSSNGSEKKVSKLFKSCTPKKAEKLPKKRKLQSTGEVVATHLDPCSPDKKQKKDDFLELIQNVPPNMSYSRVTVIPTTVCSIDKFIKPNHEDIQVPTLNLKDISNVVTSREIVATSKKIGFLGLGVIGQRMVKNLLHSNHDVTIWNRSPQKLDAFCAIGARKALTPADVVFNCDLIFCCVSDSAAVKAIVYGNFGILSGLDSCRIGNKGYIEMTSIDPVVSVEIAEAISSKGGKYLEAPVSGSIQQAEEGNLTILAAGDLDLFQECTTCFSATSSQVYFLSSEVGNGVKMNLILSSLTGTTCAALAEAMALVERVKLPQSSFLEILGLSPQNCAMLYEKGQCMAARDFDSSNALKHQQNDMNMTLAVGHSVEQPMLITAAANELYKHARFLRYSDHDISAVLLGIKH